MGHFVKRQVQKPNIQLLCILEINNIQYFYLFSDTTSNISGTISTFQCNISVRFFFQIYFKSNNLVFVL